MPASFAALLHILRAVPATDPRLADRARYADGQAYPGWDAAWEAALHRALGERASALAAATLPMWGPEGLDALPLPLARGLAFAVARRGDARAKAWISSEASLREFAEAYARWGSWPGCQAVFAGVEQVWAPEVWRAAVVDAALSPRVEKLGLYAEHTEPLLPYLSDTQLFALLSKRTWPEAPHTEWLLARAQVGEGALWEALDACCSAAAARIAEGGSGWVWEPEQLAIWVAGIRLREAGGVVPASWGPLVAVLARQDARCVTPILACVPPAQREAWVLETLQNPSWSPSFSLLRAYPSPAVLTRLCALALETGEGWRFHAPALDLLPAALDVLLSQLPPPDDTFTALLLEDVTRAWWLASVLLRAAHPRTLPYLLRFLPLPPTPKPWERLAPWVARQWGRWPTCVLEPHLTSCAPAALHDLPPPLDTRWVEIVEGAARSRVARSLAARWVAGLPPRHPLALRLAWVAAEEPPALAAARQEESPVYQWAQTHTGEESPGDAVPPEAAAHPALAWAAVRWLGGEAPISPLLRVGRGTPDLSCAVEAWLSHRLDLLDAGEPPPAWLAVQLRAALPAVTSLPLVERLTLAAGLHPALASLEGDTLGWLLERPDALASLDALIAARRAFKPPKGQRRPSVASLERARETAKARAERGLPRPPGGPWAAWAGPVTQVEPACGRAVTQIHLWGGRRWVERRGARAVASALEGSALEGGALEGGALEGTDVWVLGEAERWRLEEGEATSLRDVAPGLRDTGVRIEPGDGFHTLLPLPGRRVLTLCAAHTMSVGVQLWCADTGRALAAAPFEDMPMAALRVGPSRVLLVGDSSVALWELGARRALTWRSSQGVRWAAGSQGQVAVGCEDQTLQFLTWRSAALQEAGEKWRVDAAYGKGWTPQVEGDDRAAAGVGAPLADGRAVLVAHPDGLAVWEAAALTGWLLWPEGEGALWAEVLGEVAVVGQGRRVEAWSLATRARCAAWVAPAPLTARAVGEGEVWLGCDDGALWRLPVGP